MADVFFSYAHADRDALRRLADAVRNQGYSVWWDEDIPAHVSYGDLIADKIRASSAAIVLWSANSIGSQWVRAEADVARGAGKLIQVALDGSLPPLPFNMLHAASLEGWEGEAEHNGWRQVRSSLEALCGPSDGPKPSPESVPPPPVALPPAPPAEEAPPSSTKAPSRTPSRPALWIGLGVGLVLALVVAAFLLRKPAAPSIASAPPQAALEPGTGGAAPRLTAPLPPETSGKPVDGAGLDGNWSLLWSYQRQTYFGRLSVAGAVATLDVRALGNRIRQDCSVAPEGQGAVIRCRNPRFLSGRGRYLPDSFSLPRTDGRIITGQLIDQPGGATAQVTFIRL